MINKLNKLKNCIVFLVFLTGSIFFIGCSSHSIASSKVSQEYLSMKLNSQPEYQPLLTGQPQTHGMRSGRVYLKPGEDCGTHSTEANEEMLTFLAGKGVSLTGKQEIAREVGKDSIVYVPPFTVHNIKNTGTEPLVYVYCVASIK